jgi:outer membrane protein assembly factor BamB
MYEHRRLSWPKRRVSLLLVAILAAGGNLAIGANQASAAATSVITGPPCPDVMVVAARGSGEPPQLHGQPPSDWTDPAAYREDKYFGAGEVNYSLYQSLVSSAPKLHFSLDPVLYPADAVFPDVVTGIANYKASAQSGADRVVADVAQIERFCGSGVKYLFTGFSSGDWSLHKALYKLPKATLAKVVGVSFFGDPEFVSGQAIVRDFKRQDVYNGSAVATATDLANTNVPSSIRNITGSWCLPPDPVCQTGPLNAPWLALCAANNPLCPHFQYPEQETAKAVKFLLPNLPSKSIWPHLTLSKRPVGTVGKAYKWTATAAPTARVTYAWSASGTLPPGLKLSAAGVLSGVPTKAGNYSFMVTATSDKQRTVSGQVPVTINGGVVTPPPPTPSDGSDWAQAGGDPGHDNFNAGEQTLSAGNVGQLTKAWSTGQDSISAQTLAYQGTVYGADWTDTPSGFQFFITARSLANGSVKWTQPTGANSSTRLYAAGNGELVYKAENVFGGVRSYTLNAVNLSDGTPKWRLAMDGTKIITSLRTQWEVLDAATGQQLWREDMHGNDSFAVGGGLIVRATRIADAGGNFNEVLQGVSEADGHIVWSVDGTIDGGDYTVEAISGSTVYVSNLYTGVIEARDLDTGALSWQLAGSTDALQSDMFVSQNFAANGQTLYAATIRDTDGETGTLGYTATVRGYNGAQETWHHVLPAAANSAIVTVTAANGVVYATGTDDATATGTVYALNAATGQLLWTSPVIAGYSRPFVAGGRLVVNSDVYAAS